MKKHITLAILFIFFASTATIFAQAQQSNTNMNQMNMPAGSQMNMPYGNCGKMMRGHMPGGMQMGMPCSHCGMMMRGYMPGGMQMGMPYGTMMNPVTDKQVKDLVNGYLKNNNLKGYSVVSIKKFDSYMGPEYYAELKDTSGNLFNLAITYDGMVSGPFPTSEIK